MWNWKLGFNQESQLSINLMQNDEIEKNPKLKTNQSKKEKKKKKEWVLNMKGEQNEGVELKK